jgi:hypothetical protein
LKFELRQIPGVESIESDSILQYGVAFDPSTAGAFALFKFQVLNRSRYSHSWNDKKFFQTDKEATMAKGIEQKKDAKKKPTTTLKEKRQKKQVKKTNKPHTPT